MPRRATGRLVAILTAAYALAVATTGAQTPTPSGLQPGPPPAAADRAAALEAEAARLALESRTLLEELRRLEAERARQAERARLAEAAVAAASRAMSEADARLVQLERDQAAALPDIRARLVDLYKRGRGSAARALLGADSLRDFARTLRATAAMAALTDSRVREFQERAGLAKRERSERQAVLERLQRENRELRAARSEADRAVASRTALLADIDRRRDLTAQMAGELQIATRRLEDQVTSLAAQPASPSPAAPVFPPRLPVRGGLEWPLNGEVIGRFGEVSARTPGGPVRNGIEIEAPLDAQVHAIHAGTVVFAAPLTGFGNLVIVDHGRGYHSVYAYLSSSSVSRGDAVDVGREVGRAGAGPGGASAVYFEFRVDGRSVDPLQWLRQR